MIALRFVPGQRDPKVFHGGLDVTSMTRRVVLLPLGRCELELMHEPPHLNEDTGQLATWYEEDEYEVLT